MIGIIDFAKANITQIDELARQINVSYIRKFTYMRYLHILRDLNIQSNKYNRRKSRVIVDGTVVGDDDFIRVERVT